MLHVAGTGRRYDLQLTVTQLSSKMRRAVTQAQLSVQCPSILAGQQAVYAYKHGRVQHVILRSNEYYIHNM